MIKSNKKEQFSSDGTELQEITMEGLDPNKRVKPETENQPKAAKEPAAEKKQQEIVPFRHFFMFCTPREKVMIVIGYVASALAGLLVPSLAILMGEITISFDPAFSRKDTLTAMT